MIPRHTIRQQDGTIFFRLVEDKEGAWVTYANHDALVTKLEERIRQLTETIHPLITYLGDVDCYTPACGWDGVQMGRASVFRIGRQERVVCQRCGGCWSLTPGHKEQFK